MPHIIVKMYSGRSEQEKYRLADEITKAVTRTLGQDDDAVSVAIEDVDPRDWPTKIYKADIMANPQKLYKKPGYTM